MTPDVNVLVSAFRPDHPHHQPAQKWLDEAVRQAANGQASFSLMGMVVTGFMRITSNPKIFKQTDPLADVCSFIDSLLSCPGVQFQQLRQPIAPIQTDRSNGHQHVFHSH